MNVHISKSTINFRDNEVFDDIQSEYTVLMMYLQNTRNFGTQVLSI